MLRSLDALRTVMAGTLLRHELDRIPLWRGDCVAVKQLAEDFARYPYLPRLRNVAVLARSVRDGAALLTWEQDTFAFADSADEGGARYRGLKAGQLLEFVGDDLAGVLVRPDVAREQLRREVSANGEAAAVAGVSATAGVGPPASAGAAPRSALMPKRFHGSAVLDSARVGRDASRIADEVVAHLSGLVGASVRVTLEIEAAIPNGAPENVVRVVTENARTLKFSNQGFEEE